MCHLVEALEVAQPLVSHHLRVLRDAGLVDVANGTATGPTTGSVPTPSPPLGRTHHRAGRRTRRPPATGAGPAAEPMTPTLGRKVTAEAVGTGAPRRGRRRLGDLRPAPLARRRRPPAARELDRHRRRPRRAHPRLRLGLRRPLQPRRHPRRPALRRHSPPASSLAYIPAQIAGACVGRRGREPHVRARRRHPLDPRPAPPGGLWLGEVVATFGLLIVILGVVRSGPSRRRALRRRRLHRRRLLVHLVDQLRQPRRHHRPHPQRHLRRHRARRPRPPSSPPSSSAAALAIALARYLYPDLPAVDLVVPHDQAEAA